MKARHFAIFCLFVLPLSMSLLTSCGDEAEEVRGCTDSISDNYNPNATIDDGSCIAPNQKFIASYLGSFACPGLFSVINQDTVVFEITDPVDPNEKSKVTIAFVVSGIPIALEADVDGNSLVFSDVTLDNVPFEFSGTMVEADITFAGGAIISGNVITAELMVTANTAFGALVDNCTLVGTKT